MNLPDRIFNSVLAFLIKGFFHPKKFYEGGVEFELPNPAIYVINHTGHMDGPVVNTALRPLKIRSLAAKDRYEEKWLGFLIRHTGCIPIDRQKPDTSWIYASLDVLHKQNESVAIYPEGRHGGHRQMLPFHPGVMMLAMMAGVPVVLIYQDGPQKWFRQSKFIISKPLQIVPSAQGLSADFVQSQTLLLQDKMKELMDELVSRIG